MSLIWSKLLQKNIEWSDEEIAAKEHYIKWEELNLKWEDIDLTWDEIFILLEVDVVIKKGGGYGYVEYEKNNPWKKLKKEIGEEKTKKVIKLFCKVNNIESQYEAMVNEDIKVSVNDFEYFIKESIEKKVTIKF